MTLQERSSGVVLFHERPSEPRHYLLLHYPSGHWDFPKGHIEAGESETEAALREVAEETGIRHVELVEGFRHAFEYWYHRSNRRVRKEVIYFLGRVRGRDVAISHEHQGFVWLAYDGALKRITYNNAKDLLRMSETFLATGRKGAPEKKSAKPPRRRPTGS